MKLPTGVTSSFPCRLGEALKTRSGREDCLVFPFSSSPFRDPFSGSAWYGGKRQKEAVVCLTPPYPSLAKAG